MTLLSLSMKMQQILYLEVKPVCGENLWILAMSLLEYGLKLLLFLKCKPLKYIKELTFIDCGTM